MNTAGIKQGVIATLRECALGGSDRDLRTSDQLGETGLGLDSLALVQFVSGLESRYRVQFPDDFWIERGQLTLQHFIDFIVESNGSVDRSARAPEQPDNFPVAGEPGTAREKLARVIEEEGRLRGALWILKKLLGRIYRAEPIRFILAYDLESDNIPQHKPDIDVELRIAGFHDEEPLSRIEVVQHDKTMSAGYFRERLESGFICLVAYHNGQVVGVDWVSDEGQEEYVTTGLKFEMEADSCYGLELYEDKRHMGKGIGLALLAHSLGVCRDKGYRRQITWVDGRNTPMLSSSVQLLGARKIGEFRVRRILNRPHTTWTLEGRKGSGNIVRI